MTERDPRRFSGRHLSFFDRKEKETGAIGGQKEKTGPPKLTIREHMVLFVCRVLLDRRVKK